MSTGTATFPTQNPTDSGRQADHMLGKAWLHAVQNRRAASFAAAIRDDLVAVAAVAGDDSAIRWDKEQVMAASDTDAAFRRLDETRRQLLRIITRGNRVVLSVVACGEQVVRRCPAPTPGRSKPRREP